MKSERCPYHGEQWMMEKGTRICFYCMMPCEDRAYARKRPIHATTDSPDLTEDVRSCERGTGEGEEHEFVLHAHAHEKYAMQWRLCRKCGRSEDAIKHFGWRCPGDVIHAPPEPEPEICRDVDSPECYRIGDPEPSALGLAVKALDALSILLTNAALVPDPRMNGLTDCYAVSLDDFDMVTTALAKIKELTDE